MTRFAGKRFFCFYRLSIKRSPKNLRPDYRGRPENIRVSVPHSYSCYLCYRFHNEIYSGPLSGTELANLHFSHHLIQLSGQCRIKIKSDRPYALFFSSLMFKQKDNFSGSTRFSSLCTVYALRIPGILTIWQKENLLMGSCSQKRVN